MNIRLPHFSWNKGRVLRGHQLIYVSGRGFESNSLIDRVTEGTCMFRMPVYGIVISPIPIQAGMNTGLALTAIMRMI